MIIPMGLIASVALISGSASAKKAPAPTISCTSLTATLTFSPALQPGTATTAKLYHTTITNGSASGCTTNPTSGVTASTSVEAKPVVNKAGNSCENLVNPPAGKPSKYQFTVQWNNSGGTSVIKFTGATFHTSPPSFSLSGGKATGSYATKNTAAITGDVSSASATAIATCAGGSGSPLSSITVNGGSVSS